MIVSIIIKSNGHIYIYIWCTWFGTLCPFCVQIVLPIRFQLISSISQSTCNSKSLFMHSSK